MGVLTVALIGGCHIGNLINSSLWFILFVRGGGFWGNVVDRYLLVIALRSSLVENCGGTRSTSHRLPNNNSRNIGHHDSLGAASNGLI